MSDRLDKSVRWWPQATFDWVPSDQVARALAARVHANDLALTEPSRLAEALGIRLRRQVLSGGFQALLIPGVNPRFEIVCDPRASDMRSASFRVAHEIAHTTFYRWDERIPVRTRSASRAEEMFCDSFAVALIDLKEPRTAAS